MPIRFETLAVHGGQHPDPTTLSRGVPVYRTSSYLFKSAEHAAKLFGLAEQGNVYGRLGNPTQAMLEERMSLLEGGFGVGYVRHFFDDRQSGEAGGRNRLGEQPVRRNVHPVQRHPAPVRDHDTLREAAGF